uniref:Uncharacterized protein n=1 Tax=Lactuca sativa TaxID=4236 RepID=A0A9R1X3I2_LACSA|nr:hypothetical protein LSAT_V11C700364270 [Lactuca sativa]
MLNCLINVSFDCATMFKQLCFGDYVNMSMCVECHHLLCYYLICIEYTIMIQLTYNSFYFRYTTIGGILGKYPRQLVTNELLAIVSNLDDFNSICTPPNQESPIDIHIPCRDLSMHLRYVDYFKFNKQILKKIILCTLWVINMKVYKMEGSENDILQSSKSRELK